MSNPVIAAITRLINSEAEESSGRYAGLRAFIDPGRGDIYIEGVNGERLCISQHSGTVSYCPGNWADGEKTETPL